MSHFDIGDRVMVRTTRGRLRFGIVERMRGRFLFVRLENGQLAVRPHDFTPAPGSTLR